MCLCSWKFGLNNRYLVDLMKLCIDFDVLLLLRNSLGENESYLSRNANKIIPLLIDLRSILSQNAGVKPPVVVSMKYLLHA